MVGGGVRPVERLLLLGSLVLIGVAASILVLVSPLALSTLDELGDRDWQRLSEIGQTYGAVSALLSVVALGGVVGSLVLQIRSARLDRHQSHRAVHIQLIRMAMEDPDLLVLWRFPEETSLVERRQSLYCNQVISWFEMSFDVGAIGEEWVRAGADELFDSPICRRWWQRARELRAAPTSARGRRIRVILDEQWKLATQRAEGDLARPTAGADPERPAPMHVKGKPQPEPPPG